MPSKPSTSHLMAKEIAQTCLRWGVDKGEVVALIERLCSLVHTKKENWSVLVTLGMLHRDIHKVLGHEECGLKESAFLRFVTNAILALERSAQKSGVDL